MNDVFNFQVIAILFVFILFIGLMIAKKIPALLALPLLGVIVAIIAGIPFMEPSKEGGQTIMDFVIGQGGVRLASTIVAAIYGAVFAKVIQKQGISNAIIRKAAELAGDKPIVIAFVLSGATALVFSAIGGAGAVIMVSTIVIPLMLSAGISAKASASLVLMGISLGGLFNVANYQFYADVIGMDMELVKTSSLVIGAISLVALIVYIVLNVNKKNTQTAWAMPSSDKENKQVSFFAIISPLIPIMLVFFFKISAEVALLISILYTILVTKPKEIVQILSSSFVEGIQEVSGVIGLMIGIGILLNGVSAEATTALMQPVIKTVLPSTPVLYVIVFTICAPLALYRGPLNMYGLGSGLSNIMLAAGTLSPTAVGMALRSTGVVQGVSDPTNTQNVIVADFAKVDVNEILKSTLPYTMVITLIALIYTAMFIF